MLTVGIRSRTPLSYEHPSFYFLSLQLSFVAQNTPTACRVSLSLPKSRRTTVLSINSGPKPSLATLQKPSKKKLFGSSALFPSRTFPWLSSSSADLETTQPQNPICQARKSNFVTPLPFESFLLYLPESTFIGPSNLSLKKCTFSDNAEIRNPFT
ncbi:hypothetical protein K402DRAFT_205318 [Aulographum hederae CBS 113979]|uniref:Uncharacterized protein n=1 Tax=Aulographum hederae CBS 113979 TaxID=1176131 RepID=A0A6G1HCT7_9PEZI|nr:hypothetical protein K402DRAFT_205318 [Aulographum hederae CBS 113979]